MLSVLTLAFAGLVEQILKHIAELFRLERYCKEQSLAGEIKCKHWLTWSKPVVDRFIERVQELLQSQAFLPS